MYGMHTIGCRYIEGILPKGPYLPCVSMAGRALLAAYPWYKAYLINCTPLSSHCFTRALYITHEMVVCHGSSGNFNTCALIISARTKTADICRRDIEMTLFEWKLVCFDCHLTRVCSKGLILCYFFKSSVITIPAGGQVPLPLSYLQVQG